MVSHPQRIRDDRQRRIDRAARNEETAVHDVEIVHVVRAAVEVEHGRRGVFAEFARADLVAEAVHRHLRREIAGLGREIIHLGHDVTAATDFLQTCDLRRTTFQETGE